MTKKTTGFGMRSEEQKTTEVSKLKLSPPPAAMKYSQGNADVGSISSSRWENGKVLMCITQRALRNKAIHGQTLLDVFLPVDHHLKSTCTDDDVGVCRTALSLIGDVDK